ncbi:MAG: hypothetical protein ACTS3F_01650 [Phycisphaerales bacterium]
MAVGVDESGGLDSGVVSVLFLNGVSFPLLDTPLDEHVDAITAWRDRLGYAGSTPVAPTACAGDVGGDGVNNSNDWSNDLGLLLGLFGSSCP